MSEITAKAIPQFGLSFKIDNDGATYVFDDCLARDSVVEELKEAMKTQDDIEYHIFDVPACPDCTEEIQTNRLTLA